MDRSKVMDTTEGDEDAALDAAGRIFWEKGYEGATLDDLTAAMGISRPILNATYGNKQSLFKLVLERYKENTAVFIGEALALPNIQAVIKALLHNVVEFLGLPDNAHRCLAIQSANSCGSDSEPIRAEMVEWRKQTEVTLLKRFMKAQTDIDLPDAINPEEVAHYIATLITGMAVQAANGATKSDLKRTVDLSVRLMRGVIFDTNRANGVSK